MASMPVEDNYDSLWKSLNLSPPKTTVLDCRVDSPFIEEKPQLQFTECNKIAASNRPKLKDIASKIAEVDTLVRRIKSLEKENESVKDELKDLNQNALNIKELYENEKNMNMSLSKQLANFKDINEQLHAENVNTKFEYEQMLAKYSDYISVETYNKLVLKYLNMCHRFETSDKVFDNQLLDYCKKNNLKVSQTTSKQSEKGGKKSKNIDAKALEARKKQMLSKCTQYDIPECEKHSQSIQCNIYNQTNSIGIQCDANVKSSATVSTNTESVFMEKQVVKKDVKSQGTQHKSSTITRGTTTECFIKKHNVATMFPDTHCPSYEDNILQDIMKITRMAVISPILDKETKSTSTDLPATKSIGTCTIICNVRKQVDYTPPVTMGHTKCSCSRPNSAVKNEATTPTVSQEAPNHNANDNGQHSLQSNYTFFMSFWQIVVQLLWGLLKSDSAGRRNPLHSSADLNNGHFEDVDYVTFSNHCQIFGKMLWGLITLEGTDLRPMISTSKANSFKTNPAYSNSSIKVWDILFKMLKGFLTSDFAPNLNDLQSNFDINSEQSEKEFRASPPLIRTDPLTSQENLMHPQPVRGVGQCERVNSKNSNGLTKEKSFSLDDDNSIDPEIFPHSKNSDTMQQNYVDKISNLLLKSSTNETATESSLKSSCQNELNSTKEQKKVSNDTDTFSCSTPNKSSLDDISSQTKINANSMTIIPDAQVELFPKSNGLSQNDNSSKTSILKRKASCENVHKAAYSKLESNTKEKQNTSLGIQTLEMQCNPNETGSKIKVVSMQEEVETVRDVQPEKDKSDNQYHFEFSHSISGPFNNTKTKNKSSDDGITKTINLTAVSEFSSEREQSYLNVGSSLDKISSIFGEDNLLRKSPDQITRNIAKEVNRNPNESLEDNNSITSGLDNCDKERGNLENIENYDSNFKTAKETDLNNQHKHKEGEAPSSPVIVGNDMGPEWCFPSLSDSSSDEESMSISIEGPNLSEELCSDENLIRKRSISESSDSSIEGNPSQENNVECLENSSSSKQVSNELFCRNSKELESPRKVFGVEKLTNNSNKTSKSPVTLPDIKSVTSIPQLRNMGKLSTFRAVSSNVRKRIRIAPIKNRRSSSANAKKYKISVSSEDKQKIHEITKKYSQNSDARKTQDQEMNLPPKAEVSIDIIPEEEPVTGNLSIIEDFIFSDSDDDKEVEKSDGVTKENSIEKGRNSSASSGASVRSLSDETTDLLTSQTKPIVANEIEDSFSSLKPESTIKLSKPLEQDSFIDDDSAVLMKNDSEKFGKTCGKPNASYEAEFSVFNQGKQNSFRSEICKDRRSDFPQITQSISKETPTVDIMSSLFSSSNRRSSVTELFNDFCPSFLKLGPVASYQSSTFENNSGFRTKAFEDPTEKPNVPCIRKRFSSDSSLKTDNSSPSFLSSSFVNTSLQISTDTNTDQFSRKRKLSSSPDSFTVSKFNNFIPQNIVGKYTNKNYILNPLPMHKSKSHGHEEMPDSTLKKSPEKPESSIGFFKEIENCDISLEKSNQVNDFNVRKQGSNELPIEKTDRLHFVPDSTEALEKSNLALDRFQKANTKNDSVLSEPPAKMYQPYKECFMTENSSSNSSSQVRESSIVKPTIEAYCGKSFSNWESSSNVLESPMSPPLSPLLEHFENERTRTIPSHSKYATEKPMKKSTLGYALKNYDLSLFSKEKPNLSKADNVDLETAAINRLKDSFQYYLLNSTQKNENDHALNFSNVFQTNSSSLDYKISALVLCLKDLPTKEALQNDDLYCMQQQRVQAVLFHLDRENPEVQNKLLLKIEKTLFNCQNSEKLKLSEALNLTHLYFFINDLHPKQIHTARLFIAKCLYYHSEKSVRMIFEVVCKYPRVLPRRYDACYDQSDPLINVLKHILMSTRYDMNNDELKGKLLLSKLRYEYYFEPFLPSREDVKKILFDKLRTGQLRNLSFSFALFCKKMPQDIVLRDIIMERLLPLLKDYYSKALDIEAFDNEISCVLETTSLVLKPFPISHDVQGFLRIFSQYLNNIKRPLIQETAVQSILRLQRFGYVNAYNALVDFTPTFDLQPMTKAMIRTFLHRKPQFFWQTLEKQSSLFLSGS